MLYKLVLIWLICHKLDFYFDSDNSAKNYQFSNRSLTVAGRVAGPPAPTAPAGVRAVDMGVGCALFSGVALVLIGGSVWGGPVTHPDLPQLLINLQPFQSQLLHFLQNTNKRLSFTNTSAAFHRYG